MVKRTIKDYVVDIPTAFILSTVSCIIVNGKTWKDIVEMKKLLSMLMLSLVLVLAACGGNDAPKEELSADEQSKEEPKKDDSVVEEEPEPEPEAPTIAEIEEEVVVEEPVEEEPVLQEEAEDVAQVESSTYITVEEVKEIIEYSALGGEDTLINASVEGDEIKASIDVAPFGSFPIKDLAISIYSTASDELLERDDWQVLTIDFGGIGTVSMHRFEKETNEMGDYFPSAKMEEQLNY